MEKVSFGKIFRVFSINVLKLYKEVSANYDTVLSSPKTGN